jgi:hypothetical protein
MGGCPGTSMLGVFRLLEGKTGFTLCEGSVRPWDYSKVSSIMLKS